MGTTGKLDIRHECPSVEQYLALRKEAGLSAMSAEGAAIGLPRSIFAVTLYEEDSLVGMGRVIGDGDAFSGYGYRSEAFLSGSRFREIDHVGNQGISSYCTGQGLCQSNRGWEASKLYAQYGFESVMPRSQGMFLRP